MSKATEWIKEKKRTRDGRAEISLALLCFVMFAPLVIIGWKFFLALAILLSPIAVLVWLVMRWINKGERY